MPFYQVKCNECRATDSIYRTVANRNTDLPRCHGEMVRTIVAPVVVTDIPAYISPATGRVINSRTSMRDDLERSGHIMNEPGLKQDVARWKTEKDAALFKPVEKAIDAQVTALVNSGKIES